MTDTTTPLEKLHAAIQDFSNSLADNESQCGFVPIAVVAWEEVSYDADGNPQRQLLYAVTGDGHTLSSALGLATYLHGTLKEVIL